jgi:hypothetical protein
VTLEMWCWLQKPVLIAALNVEIDAMSDDPHALDDATRAAKLKVIESDRLATERDEVALINLAAKAGHAVAFRSDSDVRALLELSDDLVPALPE